MIVVWSGVSFQLFFALTLEAVSVRLFTTKQNMLGVVSSPLRAPCQLPRSAGVVCPLSVYREVCRVLCAVSTRRVVLRTRLPSRAPRILRRSAWVDERL